MIEFKRKYSLQNGNKINKKNWQKVIAKSNKPCTGVHGVMAIDQAIKEKGEYFEQWKLVYEENAAPERTGYIFREINHNGGICGMWPTYRQAIFHALNSHIQIFLTD